MEPDEPPRKDYVMKEREFERVNAVPGTQARSSEHDIHSILEQNRAVEQRKGLNEVVIKQTVSRRKRDFWLLFVPSNLLLAILTWQGRDNPFFLTAGLSAMVLVSLGLTWIMWFVMGDY
jgi:hypothetical protein